MPGTVGDQSITSAGPEEPTISRRRPSPSWRPPRKSLDIAVQELESLLIAEVLRAHRRGVRVRLALERDYLTRTEQWPTRVLGKRELRKVKGVIFPERGLS